MTILIALIGVIFEIVLGAVVYITLGTLTMLAICFVALVAIPCEIVLQIAECFERRPAPH